jgi:hypothetical protein
MAHLEKRDELNHASTEERARHERREVHGHDFRMDVHPERYPRESLTRLEQGILEDNEARHAIDHLGSSIPDMVERIEDRRNLSRLLIFLGTVLFIFAWVLLLFVGWDVRSGAVFFSTMCAAAVAIGSFLLVWGYLARNTVLKMSAPGSHPIEEKLGRVRTERELREGNPAT